MSRPEPPSSEYVYTLRYEEECGHCGSKTIKIVDVGFLSIEGTFYFYINEELNIKAAWDWIQRASITDKKSYGSPQSLGIFLGSSEISFRTFFNDTMKKGLKKDAHFYDQNGFPFIRVEKNDETD